MLIKYRRFISKVEVRTSSDAGNVSLELLENPKAVALKRSVKTQT